MKDYRINKKENKGYIITANCVSRKFDDKEENVLDVYFADGRVFKNIELNNENVKKIIDQQEKQAKEGVDNLSVFKKRLTRAGAMLGVGITGCLTGFSSSGIIEEIAPTIEAEPIAIGIGIGLLTIFGIPSLWKMRKNESIIKELNKVKYRNDHKEMLSSYAEYHNSLAGLDKGTINMLKTAVKTEEDPFAVINIDAYTQDDMEKIVGNIEREKQYAFTYRQHSAPQEKKD